MNSTVKIQKNPDKKQMTITHSYETSLETVWNAHTQSEIIEKWWAPQPYKAIVVNNNFVKGGRLHYYMLSPEGEKHFCIAEYLEINPLKSYEVLDAFCDESAVINVNFPRMKWLNDFSYQNGITTVTNIITFEKSEDMAQILELGFEEGYTMGLNQLYDLLNQK